MFESVNVCDVLMVQRGQRFGFALKPSDAFSISGKPLRKDLNGDVSVELTIARAIDLAL
jgi:hypothetical protein